jgi:hypothetical protein
MTNRNTGKDREATAFQERAPYDESIDLRTDFVMVYGLNDTTPQRIARWREAGYRVHLMTGISWGNYQDYLDGRWDGSDHWADAQTAADGTPILHGHSTDIPYMVPTFSFTEYLVQKLRPILLMANAGVIAATGDAAPDTWRRLVAYMLQSYAASPAARTEELPPAPNPRALYRAMIRLSR